MIPLVKSFFPPAKELMPELEKVIYGGYVAEGEYVYAFEQKFGEYVSNPYSLSLNSGTAALHIALMLAGVGKGDEVISTALTAEPTNVAIKLTGAKVVWGDVDIQTGLLDPKSVREKISHRTKAIMLVHYAGMVCNLDEFNKIAAEYNIPLIEDAAHALGSRYNKKPIGSNASYTVFSLQAIKHMTTVDGGFLCVKDKSAFDKGRLKRWFGLDKTKARLENDITEAGYKYHMNNVNATIGLVQMRHIKEIVAKYIDNGKFYDNALKNIPGVETLHYYPNTESSYWLYTMKVDRRSDFIKVMEANGITASELHLRNDRHSIFAESKIELPQLDEFYKKMVHIPCGWWITKEDREKIVETIQKGW
ncbi:MAG: DegT/DnrJ/EryC1/StrS family aminotransferase [Prevotellaceae bacterium]|jgi:dTDP-4-amino-4,6-dideoxygalactose transaminase|nr:DegT/DnrJ/EryC1/StrS family aminotransferase [Prevotellaceae bacterium]